MQPFLESWYASSRTSVGLFWMAFWAFALGYFVSSVIQVFVTRERMQKSMGEDGPKAVVLGSLFGFVSSSCSFAALSTTRALFAKGAGLVPSLAFLLASTNLVIELGILISVFLGWQFVVGEYVGGLLLICFMWLLVRLTLSRQLTKTMRERAKELSHDHDDGEDEQPKWTQRITQMRAWKMVAKRYCMEWSMVWKDVTIGFTVAGVIAAFVPNAFFESLFVGSTHDDPAFWQVLLQAVIGPVAAFFTFIGSMGNIPLAAVLFGNGVAFAGVMAFIFSDLVVLPVLRIQAKYYGWKGALYIMSIFLVILVAASLMLHYTFAWLGIMPDPTVVKQMTDRQFFAIDYAFFLNIFFLALTAWFVAWKWTQKEKHMQHDHGDKSTLDRVLLVAALGAYGWLIGGLIVGLWLPA
jgi:hypothetical protein